MIFSLCHGVADVQSAFNFFNSLLFVVLISFSVAVHYNKCHVLSGNTLIFFLKLSGTDLIDLSVRDRQ